MSAMWWTQSKAIKHLRDMLRNGASVEACIERLIAIDASMPKYVQCRNGRIGYRNGVPVFRYCGAYECWFHRHQRIHQNIERIIAEIAGYTPKRWYLLTIGYEDVTRPTVTEEQKRKFVGKVRSILHAWRECASRNGRRMKRVNVYGFKSGSGQMHSHILTDWMHPDATFSHHRQSHEVWRSQWLESLCEQSETICHVEIVSDPLAVGHYLARNIESTIGQIPSKVVRCAFSASWRGWSEVMESRIEIRYCSQCGQIRAEVDGRCHCGGRDWSQGRTAYRTSENLPEGGAPTLYKYGNTHAPPENAPMKQCSQCGNSYPHCKPYYQGNGDGKLESACRWCRTGRNRTPKRRRMFKASRHNRRAREAAKGHSSAIESMSTLSADDVAELYMANGGDSGDCCYCGHPLAGDWSIDHVMPLSRGGSNDLSNLLIVHSRCNSRKGDMTPEQWASECGSVGIVIDGITPDTMPIQKRLELGHDV